MSAVRRQTQVYILRLWAEHLKKKGSPLHGEIEHVGTRQVLRFANTERMLDFIYAEVSVDSRDEFDRSPDDGLDQAL